MTSEGDKFMNTAYTLKPNSKLAFYKMLGSKSLVKHSPIHSKNSELSKSIIEMYRRAPSVIDDYTPNSLLY